MGSSNETDKGEEGLFGPQVEQLGAALLRHQQRLVSAESCTGGWVAKVCTDRAGSSGWFERGFVTYSNEAKQEMLGVNPQTLLRYGAVSEETVEEMALGAFMHSRADFAVAISGIAGPTGGSEAKPVGTVCFAWCSKGTEVTRTTVRFDGDRDAIRRQATLYALRGCVACLEK